MDQKTLKKGCAVALAVYVLLAIAFYFICGDQLKFRDDSTDMLSANGVIGEITSDMELIQPMRLDGDQLMGITLYGATYARENTGILHLELRSKGETLATADVDVSSLEDNAIFYVPFARKDISGVKTAELRITAPESSPGNAVTLYVGDSYQAAHDQISAGLNANEKLRLNGAISDFALCASVQIRAFLWLGTYYWYIAGAGLVALAGYCMSLLVRNKMGKRSALLNVFVAFSRYKYLIKQLVSRDFKTKYKRSVLGVLWSFLNPLLTMLVQYIVFSTLFKSDIPNFALYLLSGIVCFNFFSEATSMALSSIVGNASLITKVYVPKYIYPLTRVMSSTINFLLALIPLFVVVLATGTPIRWSVFLLPLGIICLFALSLGIGLILASAMVFFRDTQFLWGVLSMLWMYATPIFYPESIIPASVMPFYKCNPLYHIIRFIRIVLMNGISPEPKAYLLMLIVSFVPLAIGATVFKKTQDRFVLNI